ncbi:unnamed protein product [Rhizoctonia solani]|uniref:Uncharacterized protein n=1 Tax=Rhizoctonia solani TaxID=456999 RepID=A0A8H3G9Z2_9AGAM|nr:unnamed protein product [Rhizoctonia solani]
MATASHPVVRAADFALILNAGTTRPSNASLLQADPLSGSTKALPREHRGRRQPVVQGTSITQVVDNVLM